MSRSQDETQQILNGIVNIDSSVRVIHEPSLDDLLQEIEHRTTPKIVNDKFEQDLEEIFKEFNQKYSEVDVVEKIPATITVEEMNKIIEAEKLRSARTCIII
jgi:hypothetical protein